MSLVRWTATRHMYETPWPHLHEVPVIPCKDLAEVVGGRLGMLETYLRSARYAEALDLVVNTRDAIARLEVPRKEST